MLFAQYQIQSLQIRRFLLNIHRFCEAIQRTIPPREQWRQQCPYVWVTKMADRWYGIRCISKVKITSFTYKNIFLFLLHSLLFSLFYISSYSGNCIPCLILLLYFSLCWRKPFSAIKTGNRTRNWQTPNFILWFCSNFNTNIKLECLVSHFQQSRTECL
jgi:hypothetical protein